MSGGPLTPEQASYWLISSRILVDVYWLEQSEAQVLEGADWLSPSEANSSAPCVSPSAVRTGGSAAGRQRTL